MPELSTLQPGTLNIVYGLGLRVQRLTGSFGQFLKMGQSILKSILGPPS